MIFLSAAIPSVPFVGGAMFGMNINRPGVIKWLDAILTISYAFLAISGIMAR